ncbi:hypothetical protein Bca52824_028819 [Brassica carinata]|uniref:RING-type domain-containing protein n=1 Tax=Brassica carinata TaxID=52824 RepID=A0A8X7VD41_BRACI|nr:hypothetical protein Bca52824_028819 [Brassica carinata]
MASSQVEIASLRSNFGCISDKNSQNRVGSLTGNKPRKKNKSRLGSPEKPRVNFSDSTKASKRGASSLVQIWEARLSRSNGNSPIGGQETERSLGASVQEETNLSADPSIDGESESENESKNHDPTVEIEPVTLHSVPDSGESRWGRVAEIIRRLKLTAGDNVGAVDMPVAKTYLPEFACSPRLRGRQAFTDLLTRLERDRHRELESLLERNAVSKFPQRGRLQSMLRLRSLKRGLDIQGRHPSSTKSSDLNRLEHGSTVVHLMERFRANAASSTERLSLQNRKIEETTLSKKETDLNMSYLQLQEIIVQEALEIKSDNTSPCTSVTHQESQILENTVERGTQGSQETRLLERQEASYGWEEQEEYEDEQSCYGGMSYDWFREISRPLTYWEDLRKSRYLEVMNSRSDKDDICTLIERADCERRSKLIVSRVQTHPVQPIDEASKEEQKCVIGKEDDDLSHSSSQTFASSPAGSWSSQDTGVTSTPDLLPLHNLQTNEMEIISEMRSQILQLQLEMSELRDSVKTCLDVNASLLQKSLHSENPLKRKCCVCNETQVETLLYRCGHMCTCLRCANELQCNGGKCPICCAKILDVVRVFVDTRT